MNTPDDDDSTLTATGGLGGDQSTAYRSGPPDPEKSAQEVPPEHEFELDGGLEEEG